AEKFAATVPAGGVVIYEASLPEPKAREGVRVMAFPAARIAAEAGTPKAANTALLVALTALDLHGLPLEKVLAALDASFAAKPALVERNRKVFQAAFDWAKNNL
ncbi:MAG TPA: 2-oxoacid:acceptor oxidoreductase family protein, partial [Methanomassiliicoccales archaeon]|nr:2-oxoacid:acceptor oxidoreductase family protein [Methanomassiliicoccales archaeon]